VKRLKNAKAITMNRFSRRSVVPAPTSLVKYTFAPGLGYHVVSGISRALGNALWSVVADSTSYESPVLGTNRTCCSSDHVTNLMANHVTLAHSALNIERKDMYDLDQFLLSVEMALDPACYEPLVSGLHEHRRHETPFRRIPFQQFMLLDSIFSMIDKSDLTEHRARILMHIKQKLGYDWLTPSKITQIQKLFSNRVVGTNVRRRMGKSVAVYAELARCLVFFPTVNLKALYTVHKADAARQCYGAVSGAMKHLIQTYNHRQKQEYEQRINQRQGLVDPDDFYYEAKHDAFATRTSIVVRFYRANRRGDKQAAAQNELLCRAYTKENVSLVSRMYAKIIQ
jgi:hypothetical protein